MKLYATQEVAGTLYSMPDPRVAPTTFGYVADERAASVGAKLDAFLTTLGLSPNGGAATAQTTSTTTAATAPAPTPLLQRPIVLLAIGATVAYFLTKGR